MRTENQIQRDFYERLENHTYTQKEVRKYASKIKFFVTEAQVRFAFNEALRELHRTLSYTYKKSRSQ